MLKHSFNSSFLPSVKLSLLINRDRALAKQVRRTLNVFSAPRAVTETVARNVTTAVPVTHTTLKDSVDRRIAMTFPFLLSKYETACRCKRTVINLQRHGIRLAQGIHFIDFVLVSGKYTGLYRATSIGNSSYLCSERFVKPTINKWVITCTADC